MPTYPITPAIITRVDYGICPNCKLSMKPKHYKVNATRTTKGGLRYQRIKCKMCGTSLRLFTIGNEIEAAKAKNITLSHTQGDTDYI